MLTLTCLTCNVDENQIIIFLFLVEKCKRLLSKRFLSKEHGCSSKNKVGDFIFLNAHDEATPEPNKWKLAPNFLRKAFAAV